LKILDAKMINRVLSLSKRQRITNHFKNMMIDSHPFFAKENKQSVLFIIDY